jgi:hypothetical protein
VEQSGGTSAGIRATGAGSFACVRVGRLVEIRVRRLASISDVDSLNAAVHSAVDSIGSGVVICSDHRRAAPVTGDIANNWSRAMRRTNPAIARSAFLLDPSNTMFNAQLTRIVLCSASENRRIFADVKELDDWLDGTLTKTEKEALAAFLYLAENLREGVDGI